MDMIPQDDTPQKRCTKCNKLFPATPEFFSRQRQSKDGLRPGCKICMKAQSKVYNDAHSEQHRQYNQEHSEEKSRYNKQYREAHKERIAAHKKRQYQIRKEDAHRQYVELCRLREIEKRENMRKRKREQAKLRSQTEHGKAVYSEYVKRNRARLLENGRRYRRTEHGRIQTRIKYQRRRALKMGASGSYTSSDVANQIKKQRNCCYYCGKKLSNAPRASSVDHVIPLTRGGSNSPDNLVITCQSCNSSKNNKLPHEWPQGGRLL